MGQISVGKGENKMKCAEDVYAEYVGFQMGIGDIKGFKMFTIFGDHPRKHSTVAGKTLKKLKIPIRKRGK